MPQVVLAVVDDVKDLYTCRVDGDTEAEYIYYCCDTVAILASQKHAYCAQLKRSFHAKPTVAQAELSFDDTGGMVGLRMKHGDQSIQFTIPIENVTMTFKWLEGICPAPPKPSLKARAAITLTSWFYGK